jgi:dihydroorotate dehydrogenase (NAD+) catalytic subunit
LKLETAAFGATFQNPVLLASGTCGFGQELADVLDVDDLGGFVTKSVTLEPRSGNPPPRVAEFAGGMLNSIGLANPGLAATRREKLPWIRANVRRAQVLVSVAGFKQGEYAALVEGLDGEEGFLGFELNLSCPNVDVEGGPPFALDPDAVARIVSACRARTRRPLLAKLAPNDLLIENTARVATEAGADGLTMVNTLPGILFDSPSGRPVLGAGNGGMSGPVLRPVGLWAVQRVRRATHLALVGAGGIGNAEDAVSYARAGATLVQVGTASFADPRAGLRIAREIERWGRERGVAEWRTLVAPAPSVARAQAEAVRA